MILFGRKLARDLREHWTQFIAVCLMAALSVLIFSGLEGGWRGIQTVLDDFATQYRMPDAWITGVWLTDDDIRQISDLEGVEDISVVTSVAVARADSSADHDLTLSTYDGTGINEPYIVDGEEVSDREGIWLDDSYALAGGIATGDRITISSRDIEIVLQVRGLIMQPDRVAYTGTGLVAPDHDAYGYGVVDEDTITQLGAVGPTEQAILIRGDTRMLHAEVPGILGDRYVSMSTRDTYPHVATVYERVSQIQSMSYLFSALFLLVALLSIFTSLRRLTDVQRGEIAVLKALGHSNRMIGAYFTTVAIVAVLLGCLIGLAATPILSRYVLSTQQGSFSLPLWEPAYTTTSVFLPLLLLLVCVLASWSATRPIRRASPAEGMRPDIGRARRTVLERLPGLWRRVAYGSRWAIRDASGNFARVLMGVVATAGCMMLLMTGFGMPDTLNHQIQLSYSEQYRYDTRLTVSPLITDEAREQIEDDAGVGQWVQQASVRLIPGSDRNLTLTVLGEGDLFRLLERGGEPLPTTEEAVITDRLANQFDLAVGDMVTIRVAHGTEYRVSITAIATICEPQGVILSESVWEQAGGEFTPTSYLTEEPPDEGINELPGVTGSLTLAEQRHNAQSLVDSLSSVFNLIRAFAIILAVVVLYNLGALSFTERIRDYATLRVLGFHHRELRSLASRENIATTFIGWLIGIPAGWWFLRQYVGLFSTERADYLPSVGIGSLFVASIITIIFAMTATFLLTRRIKGIDMTSALKGVE
ncbi:MAG: FtsX-like permease family protein [Beutenbergiaceae bacterium]